MTQPPNVERVRRALFLAVEPAGAGFLVSGGSNAWLVDLEAGCPCPDKQIRGGPCKHELAVELRVVRPEILTALRTLTPPVADLVRRIKQLEKELADARDWPDFYGRRHGDRTPHGMSDPVRADLESEHRDA